MTFWGVEVKPAKPYTHSHDRSRGRLRLTQAMLGNGSSTKRSVLQCNVANRSPIFLCSLFPEKVEFCGLDLEFEEEGDVVFSVVGPRSIHLSGYYPGCSKASNAGGEDDETDSFGEDIAETETGESGSYNSEDEYEDDFIDDGDIIVSEFSPPLDSPRFNSGVIIKEITDDDEKPGNGSDMCSSKKNKVHDSNIPNSNGQIVAKRKHAMILESEDEDGFPISPSHNDKNSEENKNGGKDVHKSSAREKLNAERNSVSHSTSLENQANERNQSLSAKNERDVTKKKDKHKKKKKIHIENEKAESIENISPDRSKDGAIRDEDDRNLEEVVAVNHIVAGSKEQDHEEAAAVERSSKKSDKKKKKKKRTKEETSFEGTGTMAIDNDRFDDQNVDNRLTKMSKESKKTSTIDNGSCQNELIEQTMTELKEQGDIQPQQTRTFPNGLIVEELQMGKPDGKKATSGKKVSVTYVGKLKDGKIFDSNIGQRPFTFRLGIGQVIKGWDVGVNGMRIGDKRRLTIPPSMGYGSKGVGKIPPNSWLIFDVELADAK